MQNMRRASLEPSVLGGRENYAGNYACSVCGWSCYCIGSVGKGEQVSIVCIVCCRVHPAIKLPDNPAEETGAPIG